MKHERWSIGIRRRKYYSTSREETPTTIVLRVVKFKRTVLLPSRNFHIAFSCGSTFRLRGEKRRRGILCVLDTWTSMRKVPFLLGDDLPRVIIFTLFYCYSGYDSIDKWFNNIYLYQICTKIISFCIQFKLKFMLFLLHFDFNYFISSF